MIYRKIKILFILFFILLTNISFSQEVSADSTKSLNEEKNQPGLNKNAIYISGGTFGVSYSFLNGSYERMIWGNKHRIVQSLFIRVSVGTENYGALVSSLFSTSTVKGMAYLSTFGGLIGTRNSFLEFGLGGRYLDGTETVTSGLTGSVNSYDYQEFIPAFTLGYRFQKPGGNFLFRLGIGLPEFYYLSLGFCF